jgi:hypothetical protein
LFKSKDAVAKAAAAQAAKVQAASKLSKTYYADEAIQPLIKAGVSLDDAFFFGREKSGAGQAHRQSELQ